ncbi:cation:proton antiporter [Nocardioides caldifontis]|uniref:cation:proton antiporter n=1 Tax=Nocardioides caldifontis TaxID=2588938 RepID=UPI0011DF2F63|nr:cation:proton antiporter [Nocardioides caldifontis]
MTADLLYLTVGVSLLLAVVLPAALHRHAVSAPMVLLLVGTLIGLLPFTEGLLEGPIGEHGFLEHLTELTVIVALMGVGLAIDRPLVWLSLRSWARWGATMRLLVVAMPLCIGGVALLGWGLMGLVPASALLLGAALAPTDPVLASDVQVEGPTPFDEADGEVDEEDEVRFALTSEAGLNDGGAFPFVHAAILLTSAGVVEWGVSWLAWDLVGKILVGALAGTAVGWLLAKLAFRMPAPSLRLAETGEPLLALAAVLLSYGVAELVHGYGFLAVFACAMTLRSSERGHDYHVRMHESIERLERLLTLGVLLLLGSTLTNTMLDDLTWQGVVVGTALVLVVRPVCALLALRMKGRDRLGDRCLTGGEELATAWFGVRGVGTLFYLAYAEKEAVFPGMEEVWATAGFTIALSVLVHGITATPVMRRLERAKDRGDDSAARDAGDRVES